jgi:hypothetical protein
MVILKVPMVVGVESVLCGAMPTNCLELNTCPKVRVVLDKGYDVLELYSAVIRKVCEKCKGI